MKLTFTNLINYAVVFIVFSDAFDFPKAVYNVDLRFSYFIIFFVLSLWLLLFKGIAFNKTFLFWFSAIICFSFYNVYIGKNTLMLLMKQVIGIFTSSFLFYLLVKVNKYDIKKLFRIYLNIAVLTGLIGLFQKLNHLLGFKMGYDFSYMLPSWRLYLSEAGGFLKINSILPEPSFFACAMMPAFFTAVTSYVKNSLKLLKKWESLVIIFSLFLSYSAVAYVGIVFSLLLLLYNYRKARYIIIGILSICVLVFFLYNIVDDFKIRVDDSVNVITGKTKLESANLSTFALFSHTLVA